MYTSSSSEDLDYDSDSSSNDELSADASKDTCTSYGSTEPEAALSNFALEHIYESFEYYEDDAASSQPVTTGHVSQHGVPTHALSVFDDCNGHH